MSNYKCSECGMINIDCGKEGYKTPREIELEKENERLKEKLKIAEQALQKIKEIAEENIRIADLEGLNGVYRRGLAKQILQKISECEVEGAR